MKHALSTVAMVTNHLNLPAEERLKSLGMYSIAFDIWQGLRHRGGGRVPQYFKFLTLCLWVLHGKNGLQTAFVPLNHRLVTEPLIHGIYVFALTDFSFRFVPGAVQPTLFPGHNEVHPPPHLKIHGDALDEI